MKNIGGKSQSSPTQIINASPQIMKFNRLNDKPRWRTDTNGISYTKHVRMQRGHSILHTQRKKVPKLSVLPYIKAFKQPLLKGFLFDSPFENIFRFKIK